jgi:hypothetical protein
VTTPAPSLIKRFGADLLPKLTFDAWLLASHGVEDGRLPEGRAWERAVLAQLVRPGLSEYQTAGLTTLFGGRSASGCRHELDAAARGRAGLVIAECKAQGTGITKNDVAVFDVKTFDHYAAEMPQAADQAWWRLMVSASPVSDGVRRLCAMKGIIVIEPGRVPWPVLCWLASRPSADTRLAEPLLREALRLGPKACLTMQQRWKHDGTGGLRWDLTWWTPTDLDDLTYVQQELGNDWLDLLDHHAPGWLEARAEPLIGRLRAAALVL